MPTLVLSDVAVDGDEFGTRRLPGPLHDRTGSDQGFLVGQPEPLAGLEGGEGDGQTGEPDDTVDDRVGGEGRVGHRCIADEQLDPSGQLRADLGRSIRIGDRDHLRAELLGLGDDVCVAAHTERGDDIVVGTLPDDLECLCADRAGRTQHRHRGRHCRLS